MTGAAGLARLVAIDARATGTVQFVRRIGGRRCGTVGFEWYIKVIVGREDGSVVGNNR